MINYARRDLASDARFFQQLAKDEAIVKFVVGLPVHTDGSESQKSIEARQFGAWLAETTSVEVVFFDERYSSAEAEAHLIDAGLTSKQRKQRLDMLAAQIMLSAYLEASESNRIQAPRGLDDD